MHILIINDDGPPSTKSSPYVQSLIETFRSETSHTISVVLPHKQRSWIGKAHMVGETLTPTYYDSTTGSVNSYPLSSELKDEYVLVDGTPASCAQLGLYHFFQDRGPVDLVVSGPNYGRNTTAVFALSSGTLGGALEAAVCGFKAIALSYAVLGKDDAHDAATISQASKLSVRIIEELVKGWHEGVDVYSINVPLVQGLPSKKILWTSMLGNRWGGGSCFKESYEGKIERVEESEIREGNAELEATTESEKKKVFLWAPKFAEVYKSVSDAGPGSDGWTVEEGCISVTPIKANFMHVAGIKGELKLKPLPEVDGRSAEVLNVIVDYQDSYTQPLIWEAITSVLPINTWIVAPMSFLEDAANVSKPTLQIRQYEDINFNHLVANPALSLANSFVIRKALIRKHYLASTIQYWVAKHPESILKSHFKACDSFEVDYAEFLDDALVECWDLKESLRNNEDRKPCDREWWILKPGMSDRGQGIRLFSSFADLDQIFSDWEESSSSSEDDEFEHDTSDGKTMFGENSQIVASHLRHFVCQPYINPPLLIDERKFHVRTYVVCVGALKVYVSREMLALFATKSYQPPWQSQDVNTFLTNTCVQNISNEASSKSCQRYWSLPPNIERLPLHWREEAFDQICQVTGEVFRAAALGNATDFQPLPNAFEIFGLDFLIDQMGTCWLLEINAFPDFRQTSQELKNIVVSALWKGILRAAVVPFFFTKRKTFEDSTAGYEEKLKLVLELETGFRK